MTKSIKNKLANIYHLLNSHMGPLGWWPIKGVYDKKCHIPSKKSDIFEVCVGAILTQNTNWGNVETVLRALHENHALDPVKIQGIGDDALAELIRPSGYFNQKAKKLKIFARFFQQLKQAPTREELLDIWGIGPETADSILLYGYGQCFFVVDAYTKRIFTRLGLIDEKMGYGDIRQLFETNLERRADVYNQYHALIVEHSKRYCLKNKPLCISCPLSNECAHHRLKG